MKNKFYKIVIMFFVVVILSGYSSAFALAETTENRFENIVKKCYANPENAQALDGNMEDVTRKFLQDNYESYKDKDFFAIKNYISQNIMELSYTTEYESDQNVSEYALSRSKTVEKDCVAALKSKGILSPCYAYYIIRGNFHYDPNTSKITSTGSTSLTDIRYDKPGGMYLGAYGISTNAPRITNNGYKVVFSGSVGFYAYTDATYVVVAEDYGTFYASVEGTGN